MRKQKQKAEQVRLVSNEQAKQETIQPLRDVVKEALLTVLKDESASAAAKASAGRTLLEYFDDSANARDSKRGAELTIDEIDAAIERLG
jgi:hypothetical protein